MPDVVALLDFSRVALLNVEMFTDASRGAHKRLDLVVTVALKAGGETALLIHVEFESSRKSEDFPARMFGYFAQLWLRHGVRRMLSIAMFTDDAAWRKPIPNHFEIGAPGRTTCRFEYQLIKLKHLDHQDFLDSGNPLAYALMAKMRYNKRERARLKAEFLRRMLSCPTNPARQAELAEFIDTYMPLNRAEAAEFEQIVTRDKEYEPVSKIVTSWERAGEKKGVKKGRAAEARRVLLLLLEQRFGELPEDVVKRVRAITSPKKLDALLLAVLDARSLDDLPF